MNQIKVISPLLPLNRGVAISIVSQPLLIYDARWLRHSTAGARVPLKHTHRFLRSEISQGGVPDHSRDPVCVQADGDKTQ